MEMRRESTSMTESLIPQKLQHLLGLRGLNLLFSTHAAVVQLPFRFMMSYESLSSAPYALFQTAPPSSLEHCLLVKSLWERNLIRLFSMQGQGRTSPTSISQ